VNRTLFALILIAISYFQTSAEVIEEVLAVIGDSPILASDVALAMSVELVPKEPGEATVDYRERILGALVRLELQFQDLEASASLHRLVIDDQLHFSRLRERCVEGDRLRGDLVELGLRPGDIEALAYRVAAVSAYVDQRLRPRITVTYSEIESTYLEEVAEPIRAQGAEPPALITVRDQLVELVTERKLNAEIERWLGQARERQEVTRFGR
jgi:hypothetical protein